MVQFNRNFASSPLFHLGMGLLSVPSRSLDPGAVSWGPGVQRGLLSFQQQQAIDADREEKAARRRLLEEKALREQQALDMERQQAAMRQQAMSGLLSQVPPEQRAAAEAYAMAYPDEAGKRLGGLLFEGGGAGQFEGTGMQAQAFNRVIADEMAKWRSQNPGAGAADEAAARNQLVSELSRWSLTQPRSGGIDPITGQPIMIMPTPLPGLISQRRPAPARAPTVMEPDIPLSDVLLDAGPAGAVTTPGPGVTTPPPGTQLTHRQVQEITGQAVPPGLYVQTKHGPKLQVQQDKPTEGQEKASTFSSMLDEAARNLVRFEDEAFREEGGELAKDVWTPGPVEASGLLPEWMQRHWVRSDQYKEYLANAERWAQSAIYLASGAQAPEQEVERMVRNYFRQPGDTPNQVREKIKARHVFEQSARDRGAAAGRYTQSMRGWPPVGTVEGDYEYIGGDPGKAENWRKRR